MSGISGIGILTVLFVSSVLPGQAFARTGNELLADCETESSFTDGYCLGYISGVTHSIIGDDDLSKLVCFPEGLTTNQTKDIVKKYLVDNPSKRHYLAIDLILASLFQAYPCQKK